MIVDRILKILLVLLSIDYIFAEVTKEMLLADVLSAVLPILLTVLYVKNYSGRRPYLLYFFITFALSKLVGLTSYFTELYEGEIDYWYYIGNSLYLLAYIFLILRCMITWNFKDIIKRFSVTLIILAVLGVFCVTLITETAENQLSFVEYSMEFVYNVVVMTLLSVALVNYMYMDDKKAILFFIGAMFIFFSEMLQLAYFYVAEIPQIAAIYSVFLVLAFTFFYLQSRLKHQNVSYTYLDPKMS